MMMMNATVDVGGFISCSAKRANNSTPSVTSDAVGESVSQNVHLIVVAVTAATKGILMKLDFMEDEVAVVASIVVSAVAMLSAESAGELENRTVMSTV